MPISLSKPIIFLVGPTAIGKSLVAAKLAQKIKGEIISSDSMQVYKGMDIISSQAPAALQKKIPHHLLGIIPPEKEYNVSSYRKAALACIRDIAKRGKLPIFTGGTGLYISILVDGIFEQKIIDKKIRRRLCKEVEVSGSAKLHHRLKDIDPAAALKIHPHDARRIVRALEVFTATGQPISQLQAQRKGLADECQLRIFCLNMPLEALYERINHRVEQMFRQGLLDEVKKLLKLKLSRTARYAIGIREIKEYLDGSLSLEQAKESIKKNTRNFAKRQLCWFRKDKRIQWIQVQEADSPEVIAQKILARAADPRCTAGLQRGSGLGEN